MQRAQHTRRQPRPILIIFLILVIIFGLHHFLSLGSRLKSNWNKIVYTSSNNVSIAVYSPKTHRIYTSTNAPRHKFHTASTVKVSILAGLMLKQQSPLSSTQTSLAKKMIEQSDNNATTTLFNELGGQAGLQEVFDKFDMKNSVAHKSWGLTTTTPKDQVKLLNNIFYHSKFLSNQEQTMIRNLMSNVESDQTWGISAGSNNFAIKNGWLSYGNDNWIVNSIGYVKNANGTSYTIAVYTDKNNNMTTGQQTIEQLARTTKSIMN
ncbi:MAG: serine hydrolase [Limosilactobacillus pontis]|uniref:Penicillin-binding protein n=1 Tax=Limosilactobacillus pontis TaxID=35787 RepID=A0A2J6NMR2_9LACO|nr:serine hydrolase [Limosilactobacillus pontis]PMB82605.1 penicillin-binding protein [Limosilactobacillus pontis]